MLRKELRDALARCRDAFVGVGVFSALINLLALTSAIYMLQVYDRVIPAHSVATLIGLTVLMLILYAPTASWTSSACACLAASVCASTAACATASSRLF
ncbi:MAG: hypothetical protein HC888_18965 [Candidatus Competibacteraceae bacterium]|nr:hypothetical protein [Candidatus Competibacteraceae bacterium]